MCSHHEGILRVDTYTVIIIDLEQLTVLRDDKESKTLLELVPAIIYCNPLERN